MTSALLACLVIQGPTTPIYVDGEGYLRFMVEGKVAFRREASLSINQGVLSDERGNPIAPRVNVMADAEKLEIDLEGNVVALAHGSKLSLGRIVLTVFSGSQPAGPADGYAIARDRGSLVDPGSGAAGVIRTGRRGQTPAGKATLPANRTSPARGSEASVSSDPTIRVRAFAPVEGPQIFLGDVADLEGVGSQQDALAAVSLGDSPALGVERVLDKMRIEGRLRMAGFDPRKFTLIVPAAAKVVRKGNAVEHQQFVDKALDSLKTQGGPNLTWRPATTLGPMTVPVGKIELVVEQVSATRQTASVKVAVFVDSKRFNSRTLSFSGTSNVATVPSGATVTVRVRSNAAAIEVPGRLRSAAGVGDAVTVNATYGGQNVTLTGTLISPSVVEVKL